MPLEKISITPENGSAIYAQFNPERYSLNKSVQIAEHAIPGLDAPVLQFIRGQSAKLTLELFFDTTGDGMVDDVTDVREQTSQIYALMSVQSETHAPPRCILYWGEGGKVFSFGTSVSPWCLVESVSEEFSLFSPGGVPLRAKLTVAFREYWTIEEQLQETPRHSSDRTHVRTTEHGQTLSHVASIEYGDPGAWRALAEANNLSNPRLLAPGTTLRIPRDVNLGAAS